MTRTPVETERLILVPPQAHHLAAYVAYCSSHRAQFVGGPFDAAKAFEKLCAMAGHWNLRGFGRHVMTLRTTGRAIGHVGALQIDEAEPPEMTWTLWSDDVEGQGYAFEAAHAYLETAAAATGTREMLVRIDRENLRSQRLAARLGAQPDSAATSPRWMPEAVTFRIHL